MRIVIEVDGAEVAVTTQRGDTEALHGQGAAGPMQGGDVEALHSEEAAMATTQGGDMDTTLPQAAALGPQDAGPAPATVTTQRGETKAAPPQAAALGDRDAGPKPAVAEQQPTLGAPPLPLAAPGPSAPVAGLNDLSAGAAPGTLLEALSAITIEGGQ